MKNLDPKKRLAQIVAEHGTQEAAAKTLGITQSYVSDLLRGGRGFSDTVLEKMGLARIIVERAS